MAALLEIYDQNGELVLDTNSKPIGKNFIKLNITNTQQSANSYYRPDPISMTESYSKYYYYFGGAMKQNHLNAIQVANNNLITYLLINYQALSTMQQGGNFLQIDMSEFNPIPQKNEHLQVFNNNGQMMWGSQSLINSVQLVDLVRIPLTGYNYHNSASKIYFDIPDGVDISKIYFYPIVPNATPYPSDRTSGGVDQYHLIHIKRVNRRIYLMPDFYQWINTYDGFQSRDGRDYLLSKIVGSNTLDVMIFYIPKS